MHTQNTRPAVVEENGSGAARDEELQQQWRQVVGRRSFLRGVGLAAAVTLPGSALLAGTASATGGTLTAGDVAILRLLAAIELIESDLWQQYNELGGVNGGNPAYMAALSNLDSRHAAVHRR